MRVRNLNRIGKGNVYAAVIAIAVLGIIFSPFPGIDAVSVTLSNQDISIDSGTTDNTIDFDLLIRDPTAVTFSDGTNVESIPESSIIQVVIDAGTSNEQIATFDLLGNTISSNSVIQSLSLPSVFRGDDPSGTTYGYGFFGYGYGLGYGYGQFFGAPNPDPYGYGFGYGIIEYGIYSYGLASTFFNQDTIAKYNLVLDPGSLSSGQHTIRINILEKPDSFEFFSSGDIAFSNTISLSSGEAVAPAGKAITVSASAPTLKITSKQLPSTITAGTVETSLNFESLATEFVGNDLTIETGSTATSSVAGKTIEIKIPDNVKITFPPGVKTFQLPQVATSATAPSGLSSSTVISLGGGTDERFEFNKALRLKLPGEAGKDAFFSGVLTDGKTGAKEITVTCTADDQDTVDAQLTVGGREDCKIDVGSDLIIWTKHASSFGSATGGSSSSGGGGGGGGGGGSSSGGGGGGGGAVIAGVDSVVIYDISWNMCDDNLFRVVVGPQSDGLSVKLRTGSSGVIQADLADTQSLPGRSVFEAQLSPSEKFVFVQAEAISGRGAAIAQKSVDLSQCSGSVTVNPYVPVTTPIGVPQTVESATSIVPGLTSVETPKIVHDFITANAQISNENTGLELTSFQTLQSNIDKYAEIVLGIDGQTVTTVAYQDRFGLEESNNNANLFLQISSTNEKVNSMRGVLLGGDTIKIMAGDGSMTEVPTSAEIAIASEDPVPVSVKSSMKINAKATQVDLPDVVRDFLNTNIEFTNKDTDEILTKYMVLQSVPDVFAEKELGISGQTVTTIAFPDRYGRADSNNDLNVFVQFTHTDEEVKSLRGIQQGGNTISVETNGVDQGTLAQTVEIPLN